MSIHLSEKKCVACEGGMPPLTPKEIASYQKELKAPWEVHENKRVSREFKFKDFKEAMKFVNKIADIAEEEGHHPDIHVFYNKVMIELWTHAIEGLSENDFIMAAKIEKLTSN